MSAEDEPDNVHQPQLFINYNYSSITMKLGEQFNYIVLTSRTSPD